MTTLAPATSALTISPEYLMPPSAMIGMPFGRAARAHCQTAVICGMPAPAMMRVVQIDPAPTPTLIASAPAAISASVASAVTTFPAVTGSFGHCFLIRPMAWITPAEWPWAVSIATRSTPASTSAPTRASRSAPTPTAAPARSLPCESTAAFGKSSLLLNILDGDQPLQLAIGVDQRKFFNAVLLQDGLGLLERRADRRGDQPLAGHELADRLVEIPRLEEADIAVGEDPDQLAAAPLFGDGDARDVEFAHQVFRFLKRGGGIQGDRVGDHPGFGPFNLLDKRRLGFDGEVAVDDPQPAFARERDRHARLGHGVHRGRDDRDVERDVAGEPRAHIGLVRKDRRVSGDDQQIVEGQRFMGLEEFFVHGPPEVFRWSSSLRGFAGVSRPDCCFYSSGLDTPP